MTGLQVQISVLQNYLSASRGGRCRGHWIRQIATEHPLCATVLLMGSPEAEVAIPAKSPWLIIVANALENLSQGKCCFFFFFCKFLSVLFSERNAQESEGFN